MKIEGNEIEKAATGRKASGSRRNLPPSSAGNIKKKTIVHARKHAGTMEIVRNAGQFTGHIRSMFRIA